MHPARALGGEVAGHQVLAPGPGHSPKDRSLSIRLDASAPDGFVVHSFANNEPITCKDYVRQRLGLPAWKPNGRQRRHCVSDDALEAAIMAAVSAENSKPKGKIVETYNYCDCFIRCCALSRKIFANAGRTVMANGYGNLTSGASCIACQKF